LYFTTTDVILSTTSRRLCCSVIEKLPYLFQTFDFQVNKERNKTGDNLIHRACRAGEWYITKTLCKCV